MIFPPAADRWRSVLARYRVGSVPYLNALPLTAGLDPIIAFKPPSQLARELNTNQLQTALVSTTEVLFSAEWSALSGYGILSRGPVHSVFLAHHTPLKELRVVHLDPASCTSVNLLRVLLAEQGVHPEFRPLASYADAARLPDVLLIGNPALEFRRAPHSHQLWDLGEAWQTLTGLPFTYAVWAFRNDFDPQEVAQVLTETAEFGLSHLPQLIESSPEFDLPLRRTYVGGHIQYRIDEPARAGVERFRQLLEKHTGRSTRPLHWISPAPTGVT